VARAPQAFQIGTNLEPWKQRMASLIRVRAIIIALRGAGSVNGIDPNQADSAVMSLIQYIGHLMSNGTKVALIYDGDPDLRNAPDVGSVFGRLADAFSGAHPQMEFLAVQTADWYNEPHGGPIRSASGLPYETYVFSDNLPGAHRALTQSQQLANYPNYEQVYVGPAGSIARDQLADLNTKAVARPQGVRPVRVTVMKARINPGLDAVLTAQLQAPVDARTRAKIEAKLQARATRPYGYFCTPEGRWLLNQRQYPGLTLHLLDL